MLKIKISEIDNLAKTLSGKVLIDNFHPDTLIFIEKAGLLLGLSLSKLLPFVKIIPCEAHRKLSKTKKQKSNLLSRMPDWFISILRKIEVNFKLYKNSKNRYVELKGDVDPNDKYLIVDDSLDTGFTINELIDKLVSHGVLRCNIKIAVINILSEKKLRPIVYPDYYIYKNIHIQYPWSSDSIEYRKYLELYAEVKTNFSDVKT